MRIKKLNRVSTLMPLQRSVEAGRAGEEVLRTCLDNHLDGFTVLRPVLDQAGLISDFSRVYINAAACRNIGITREDALRLTFMETHPSSKEDGLFEAYHTVYITGTPAVLTNVGAANRNAAANGRIFDINVVKAGGYLTITWRDVTASVRDRVNLRQSNERFRTIFDSGWALMSIIRMTDGVILEINQHALETLGYAREEMVGRTEASLGLIKGEGYFTAERRFKILEDGRLDNFEIRLTAKSGRAIPLLLTCALVHVNGDLCRLNIGLNVSRQKEIEAELQRLDRLNLIGELAAAIGHEVRNPLTTVRGYLQMFQRRRVFADYNGQLVTMIEELDRANDIITDFLSLARQKNVVKQPGSLKTIVEALAPLIQADAILRGHDFRLDLADTPPVPIDNGELRQLILNLAKNALEAMENKGILTIRTCCDDGAAILEVRDNGPGIPDHIVTKIGKPFITTKENGTGLGLSVCCRIAERHGTRLAVATSPEGTVISVGFPLLTGG